jgi:hypothetical protein
VGLISDKSQTDEKHGYEDEKNSANAEFKQDWIG